MFPRDPQEPKLVAWLRNPRVRRMLILCTLWIFIAVVLISFNFVLLPFAIAVLLAFIIEPGAELLTKRPIFGRRISRPIAVLTIYALTIAALTVFGSWAIAQIGREIAKVGAVTANVLRNGEEMGGTLLDRTVAFVDNNNIPLSRDEIETFFDENVANLREELSHSTARIFTLGRDVVASALRFIFTVFLVLMLTAVITMDRERIQRFFYTLVPPEYQNAYKHVTSGISVGLAGVVRGQVFICVTNGVLTFIGLWLFKVKLPLLLATIAMVFSLIPIFGSILSSIPIVAISLTDSVGKGLLMLLWIIGIHLLEANLLNPKIMGDSAKIHPIVVVFALIVGERTAGIMGALFAVPIASIVLTLFRFLHARALSDVRDAVDGGAIEGATGDLQTVAPPPPTAAAPPAPASKLPPDLPPQPAGE